MSVERKQMQSATVCQLGPSRPSSQILNLAIDYQILFALIVLLYPYIHTACIQNLKNQSHATKLTMPLYTAWVHKTTTLIPRPLCFRRSMFSLLPRQRFKSLNFCACLLGLVTYDQQLGVKETYLEKCNIIMCMPINYLAETKTWAKRRRARVLVVNDVVLHEEELETRI